LLLLLLLRAFPVPAEITAVEHLGMMCSPVLGGLLCSFIDIMVSGGRPGTGSCSASKVWSSSSWGRVDCSWCRCASSAGEEAVTASGAAVAGGGRRRARRRRPSGLVSGDGVEWWRRRLFWNKISRTPPPSVVISFGTADELVELVLLRRKSSSLVAVSSSSVFAISGTLSRVEPQWEVTSHVAHRILWFSVISQRTCFVF